MDLNLVVLSGRLAAETETRAGETPMVRLLVTVRQEAPRRRIDVVPVTCFDPPDELLGGGFGAGTPVWIAGSVQRRFTDAPDGRRGRLEVVASEVRFDRAESGQGGSSGQARR